jgi:hypothetical protein
VFVRNLESVHMSKSLFNFIQCLFCMCMFVYLNCIITFLIAKTRIFSCDL